MSITVACPQCRRSLNVPDAMAGMEGECPYCKARVPTPGPPGLTTDSLLLIMALVGIAVFMSVIAGWLILFSPLRIP